MSAPRRALITGASSGIGEAFARQLGARGTGLVLVARREDRLRGLADEVAGDAEVLAADLTTEAGLARTLARLEATDRPVDLLVNNAGFGDYGPFADIPAERLLGEVDLNVRALVALTRAVTPRLVAQGHGGIVNVSSTAGFQPGPHGAVYGGTKAFVTSFSRALAEELRGSGVRVLVVCPGVTATEYQAVAGVDVSAMPRASVQTPDQVVGEALAAYDRGRTLVVTGLANKVMALGARIGPSRVAMRVSAAVQRSWTRGR